MRSDIRHMASSIVFCSPGPDETSLHVFFQRKLPSLSMLSGGWLVAKANRLSRNWLTATGEDFLVQLWLIFVILGQFANDFLVEVLPLLPQNSCRSGTKGWHQTNNLFSCWYQQHIPSLSAFWTSSPLGPVSLTSKSSWYLLLVFPPWTGGRQTRNPATPKGEPTEAHQVDLAMRDTGIRFTRSGMPFLSPLSPLCKHHLPFRWSQRLPQLTLQLTPAINETSSIMERQQETVVGPNDSTNVPRGCRLLKDKT